MNLTLRSPASETGATAPKGVPCIAETTKARTLNFSQEAVSKGAASFFSRDFEDKRQRKAEKRREGT